MVTKSKHLKLFKDIVSKHYKKRITLTHKVCVYEIRIDPFALGYWIWIGIYDEESLLGINIRIKDQILFKMGKSFQSVVLN